MTDRLQQELQKKNLLSIYFTASFPLPHSAQTVMQALQDAGANMIELGIPFSDPLADGPIIQQSNLTAIRQNRFSIKNLLTEIKSFRENIHIPVIVMSYLNPIFQYGIEKFVSDFAAIGIDGFIIPDLPIDIYRENYQSLFKENNVSFVPLIVPNVTKERAREIAAAADSFIYLLSSSSTTGEAINKNSDAIEKFFDEHKEQLKKPILVGFGIRSREDFAHVCKSAAGAIIGSAFIRQLQDVRTEEEISPRVRAFVSGILPK